MGTAQDSTHDLIANIGKKDIVRVLCISLSSDSIYFVSKKLGEHVTLLFVRTIEYAKKYIDEEKVDFDFVIIERSEVPKDPQLLEIVKKFKLAIYVAGIEEMKKTLGWK